MTINISKKEGKEEFFFYLLLKVQTDVFIMEINVEIAQETMEKKKSYMWPICPTPGHLST